MRPKAKPTELINDDRTIITEWYFTKNAETGWHRHAHDYVVLPMADGTLQIETDDGTGFSDLQKGRPYARRAGVEHNVINATDHDFSFIEIEYK